MSALELKIPPPVVTLLLAFAMWSVPPLAGVLPMTFGARLVAGVCIAILGVGITVSGMLAFRRARTTINPLKPSATSSLVMNGVYGYTRNPMYVGLLLALTGWAVFLGEVLPLVALPVFVWYMTTFQIAPEERILSSAFGVQFTEYMRRVRRWV